MIRTRVFIFSLIFAFFGIFSVSPVFAHGGVSYLLVDGEPSEKNPVADELTNPKISIGRDIAPQVYVVNQVLTFGVDEKLLPTPGGAFQWNFGDTSEVQEGVTVTHAYSKQGMYVVNVKMRTDTQKPWVDLTTLQVLVVPTENYVTPQSVIIANGKTITNSQYDVVEVEPNTDVSFDAGRSTGKIATYQWDFGDGVTSDKAKLIHRYTDQTSFPAVVILRVTDDHGVSNDAYATVDIPFAKPNPIVEFFQNIRDWVLGLFKK